jgi:EmrB/QacA subfamily drug resistance transporter
MANSTSVTVTDTLNRGIPRPLLILGLVCLPVFIGALDLTVISAVLPQVMYDLEISLQTGLDEASWLVTGYLLAYTVTMTFMGRVSDLYGRRRVFLLCLAIFTIGSAEVALAETLPWLIVGRVVQAIGGGAMVPVSMALVGDLFPPARRAGLLGLIGAVDTAGWVVGHLYGGIMVRFFNWRLLFWLNIPISLLALGLTWWALRRLPQPRTAESLDWTGATLIALSLTALNIALGAGGELTLSSQGLDQQASMPDYALPLLFLAGGLLIVFLWVERRSSQPLLRLDLFGRPGFAAASLINFVLGYCVVVGLVNVPLFINALVARSPEEGAWVSGWLLSAFTLPMAAAAVPGGWLSNRLGFRLPAWIGLVLGAVGFLALGSWNRESSYAEMIPPLVVAGAGLGLVISPVATVVINAASELERGVAAALVIILRLVGMTIGVSAMTTFGLRRFQVISAAILAVMPPDSGGLERLVEVSVQATTRVVHEAFWLGAAGCGLAFVVAIWLKGQQRPDEAEQ